MLDGISKNVEKRMIGFVSSSLSLAESSLKKVSTNDWRSFRAPARHAMDKCVKSVEGGNRQLDEQKKLKCSLTQSFRRASAVMRKLNQRDTIRSSFDRMI